MAHAVPATTDWRASADDADYAFMLFHPEMTGTEVGGQYLATQPSCSTTTTMRPELCTTLTRALSDEEMLDEIFQEIMSPNPPDHGMTHRGFDMALFSPVVSPEGSTSATPELTSPQRHPALSSASLGSMSPHMAATLRLPNLPVGPGPRTNVFFPTVHDLKAPPGLHHTARLYASPTAAARRSYRRLARLQKKKPASRICRMPGCTKGIRSRGLCKAHGGGRRCTTPGCEISDQGGGHCIAHGGGRRCSVGGCQKSAQSKGLCKLHGGARLCRLPDCHKNGQIKGLCRLHYSLSMATNTLAQAAASSVSMGTDPDALLTLAPCDTFDLRVQQCLASMPM